MTHVISADDVRRIIHDIVCGLSDTEISLDLGMTRTRVKLGDDGFYLKNRLIRVPKIDEDENCCYIVVKNGLQPFQFFSYETNKLYKLTFKDYKPILQICGTSMSKKSFIQRIESDKLTGRVLDAGTGLGYTAITASKTAEQVITVEWDKNMLEVARLNPYSKGLFTMKNIKLILGDIVEKIKGFDDQYFDFIIFDAGTPRSSGEFFSLNNYREAYRVLKNGGKLYHYLPRHHIRRGRDFGGEVIRRIKKAGFSHVERDIDGSYIVARK